MSMPWTAPGSTAGEEPSPSMAPGGDPSGPALHGDGAAPGGGRRPGGPRRELIQSVPLFPLRPLGLGEVLGAAVRIYRLRARTVLGVAAAVYGVAFVILTFATGASLVPLYGDMQAMIEDPSATSSGMGSLRDAILTILSSALTMIITLVASSLVTVALTHVAMGEAVGRPVSTEQMWATIRRRGLPAVAVALLVGAASLMAFLVVCGLGLLPLLLVQEATWWTIVPIGVGLVLGMLVIFWIWARTVLAVPALVLEGIGVFGAIRRSLVLTRGRRLWRVLGTSLLLYLLYAFAVNVISGVFGTIAVLAYLAILLASSFEAIVLGIIVLTILSMIGSYAASFLLAPFLSAGFVAIYADSRMRHEAWDVELLRQARAAWDGDGVR